MTTHHHHPDPKDLFQAAQAGNSQQVVKLLKGGIDPNVSDRNGWTALHHAAAYNKRACLEAILTQPGVEVNPQDNRGRTPLHRASMWGNVDSVEVLIEHNADSSMRNAWGAVPLQDAIRQLTVDYNPASDKIDDLMAQLQPDRNKHVMILKILLERTDDAARMVCDEVRKNGVVPLAAFLASGLNVRTCHDDNETLLHVVCHKCDAVAVELILRYGPDLEARDRWNSTPLLVAVERNNVPIARLLLQSGANADCRDADGNTPLHMAAEAGHLEMCELLMDFGARVRAQNSKGATPAHKSAGYGRVDVLRALVSRDPTCVHAITKKKVTPLHWAARNGHVGCAKLLIASGVDVSAQNQAGEKAIDVTQSPEVKELLRQAAAMQLASAEAGRRRLSRSGSGGSGGSATMPLPGSVGAPLSGITIRTVPPPIGVPPINITGIMSPWRSPDMLSPSSVSSYGGTMSSLPESGGSGSADGDSDSGGSMLARLRIGSEVQPSLQTQTSVAFTPRAVIRSHSASALMSSTSPGAPPFGSGELMRPPSQTLLTPPPLLSPRSSLMPVTLQGSAPAPSVSALSQVAAGSVPTLQAIGPTVPQLLDPTMAAQQMQQAEMQQQQQQQLQLQQQQQDMSWQPASLPSGAVVEVEGPLEGVPHLAAESVAMTASAEDVMTATGVLFMNARLNGRRVVVKQLNVASEDAAVQTVQLYASLRHPNIARFIGYFILGGQYHLVFDVNSRGTLRSFLDRYPGALDLLRVIRIAFAAASALEYFHANTGGAATASAALSSFGSLAVPPSSTDDQPRSANTKLSLLPQHVVLDELYQPVLVELAPVAADGAGVAESTDSATLKYSAPEEVAFPGRPLDAESLHVFRYAYLLYNLLAGCDVFPNDDTAAIMAGLAHENQSYQDGGAASEADALFRPDLTAITSNESSIIFVHRLGNLMELCWDHEPQKRPPFRQIRLLLDSVRQLTDEVPLPLPLFWSHKQRLELALHVGQYLTTGIIGSTQTMVPAGASAAARASLTAQLDVAGGYITAGDWRPFFAPQLLEQAQREIHSSLSHDSIAALLRLLALAAQRLNAAGAALSPTDASWQAAMGLRTVDDLAVFVDRRFPSLAQHVYMVLRHFRVDLLASLPLAPLA